jgi:hypothetical protein
MRTHETTASTSILMTLEVPLRGILLRWNLLTQSERVACLGISLIPLWWLWGWSFLFVMLAGGVIFYEYRHHGNIQLKRPSILVLVFLAYGLYDLISGVFYSQYHAASIGFRDLTDQFESVFSPAFILWYVQSRNIRVRLTVVAWAFSVVVASMLVAWLYAVVIMHQAGFSPPRSLFGLLTKKPPLYEPGLGNTNYLIFYRASDKSIPGFVRFFLFFHGPESLALTTSFIALLALDLKKRIWSVPLFCGSVLILLMSGTRSAWLALPITILVRWLLKTGAKQGVWLIFALIACWSCLTMLPPVTEFLSDLSARTAQSSNELRGDSSDVRAEIYRRTSERILESSDWELIMGHTVPGETVLREYEPAKVGTHSFYLGTLLYRQGLLGTGLFIAYWVSLVTWFYNTRHERPIAALLILLLMTFTFTVMAYESVVNPIILICAVTHHSESLNRSSYGRY